MSETKTATATEVLHEFWKEMDTKKVYISSRNKAKNSAGTYERGEVSGKTWVVKHDAVSIGPNLLLSLNAAELKMVCKIISELKLYNAFWYYPYREIGGKPEKTIGTLRTKGILLKTENLAMHLVNPDKIRRGGYDVVVAATSKLVEERKIISEELCIHLQTPEKAYTNGYLRLLEK